MTYSPQLEWCREKIHGFKEAHDAAEKARRETEENRQRMSAYMTAANVGTAMESRNDGLTLTNWFLCARCREEEQELREEYDAIP